MSDFQEVVRELACGGIVLVEMDCEASHKIVKGWVSNLATLPRDSPPVMAMATALAAKTRKPALLDELGLIQHRIAILATMASRAVVPTTEEGFVFVLEVDPR